MIQVAVVEPVPDEVRVRRENALADVDVDVTLIPTPVVRAFAPIENAVPVVRAPTTIECPMPEVKPENVSRT